MSLVFAILRGVLGQQRACRDLLAFLDDDVRTGRNRIVGNHLVRLVTQNNLRMQVFLVLHDDDGRHARSLVELLLHRDAFDDVMERNGAWLFAKDRHVVRIPLTEHVAFLDLAVVSDGEHGANNDVIALQLAAIFVGDEDLAVLVQNDVRAFLALHGTQIHILDDAVHSWP